MAPNSQTWIELFREQERHSHGAPTKCLVIGEVAQAHDGSLGIAHSFIDAIADAGADAVKFQTHIASAESTPAEPWRVAFSRQDSSRYAYWKRMEFSEENWDGLRAHAHERGLLFLSSPFSPEAVQMLRRIGVDAWKIASGEIANREFLSELAQSGQPVILSTGMSGWDEIDAAVSTMRTAGAAFALLQCTTAYPCQAESIGLNVLEEMKSKYGCAVGLSDHSGQIFPCLAAAALKASVLEVHVTFSRQMFGPDAAASLTVEELALLVKGVRSTTQMLNSPVDKNAMADKLAGLRSTFGKSVVAARDLTTGTMLKREHLALKKPGTGIPAAKIEHVIGRRLRRSLIGDEQLKESDVE